MKNIKEKIILNDYLQTNTKNFKELKFLKKFSKSKVFVTETGLVCHKPTYNDKKSLNLWNNKIFNKKIDHDKLNYTSENAIMKSRHYYSAIFINSLLKKKKIKFCDFGSGEGNFIKELKKLNNNFKYCFTESSKVNFNKIKKSNKQLIIGFNGSIEDSSEDRRLKNLDAAALLWTLCACTNPLKVLTSISRNMKPNGLLIISESSRIMVPFKKPIYYFFNSKIKTENTHPWFFSYNSLSNLLEVSGFRIIKKNRYFDENDLVIVAKKIKNIKPKIKFEDQKEVISYLKEWCRHSIKLKKITNNFL